MPVRSIPVTTKHSRRRAGTSRVVCHAGDSESEQREIASLDGDRPRSCFYHGASWALEDVARWLPELSEARRQLWELFPERGLVHGLSEWFRPRFLDNRFVKESPPVACRARSKPAGSSSEPGGHRQPVFGVPDRPRTRSTRKTCPVGCLRAVIGSGILRRSGDIFGTHSTNRRPPETTRARSPGPPEWAVQESNLQPWD